MSDNQPRKSGKRSAAPGANRQPVGADYRPASGIPASGMPASGIPAGGIGYGGPANGIGLRGSTAAQQLSGRARNALISDLAMERVLAAMARIDAVLADDAHPHGLAAARYVIDRIAGTPAASVTVTEEPPSVVTYRWLPDPEAPGDG